MPQVLNKYKNTPSNNSVYIGRPSHWGNPYEIGRDGTREEVVEKHWHYLHSDLDLLARVREELAGKDLICFCAPKLCHGDTYLRVANVPEVINSFQDEYRFLSNFYPCEVRSRTGIIYPSSEHAYQAAKTKDLDLRRKIAQLATPGHAKRFGQLLKLREDWEEVKREVMFAILKAKFQDLMLMRLLIDTVDAILIEGNSWGDQYWGVSSGKGKNWLGKLLMKLRKELRAANGFPKLLEHRHRMA